MTHFSLGSGGGGGREEEVGSAGRGRGREEEEKKTTFCPNACFPNFLHLVLSKSNPNTVH